MLYLITMGVIIRFSLFWICLVSCQLALAQKQAVEEDYYQDPRQSSFTAELSGDSTKTSGLDLSLDIAMKSGMRLLIGANSTNAPPAEEEENLDTRELRLGVGINPQKEWSYTFNYALWGQPERIGTNTLNADILWMPKDWALSLEPQIRFVTLTYIDARTLQKKNQTFTNPSIGAAVTYVGLQNWHFRLAGTFYKYSVDISDIGAEESRYFAPSALTLSQGFPRNSSSFEFGYNFEKFSLSPAVTRMVAETDGLATYSYDIRLGLYVLKDIDFNVDIGQTPAQHGASRVGFLSVAATFIWED